MKKEYLFGQAKGLVQNCDLLSVVMICLGDPNKAKYDSLLRLLDVLFSMEMKKREKRDILENDFGIPMTQTLDEGVSNMCNCQGVEARGIAKGIAQGTAQGIVTGATEKALSNIQSLMKNMGISVEQAMNWLDVSEEDR